MYKYVVSGMKVGWNVFSSYEEYKEFINNLPPHSYPEKKLYIPIWRAGVLYNLSQYRGNREYVDNEEELNSAFGWGRTSHIAYCEDFSQEEKEFFSEYSDDRVYFCVEKEVYPGKYWLMGI